MRKLPVFFVIDVSESMAGPQHSAVADGLSEILRTLRTDPQALDSVWLSIIVFAGKSKVLTPMVELMRFFPPELPIGGGTALGPALDLLMGEIDANVTRGSVNRKGDWKPLIFLMTDGHPTDNPSAAIARWQSDYARRAQMVAISVGGGADHGMLRRLTDDIVVLSDASPASIGRFVKWMSQSIAAESASMQPGSRRGGGISLEKGLPEGAQKLAEDAPQQGRLDDRLAVFTGRCQHTEAPYLMRFEKAPSPIPGRPGARYVLRQTLPLKMSYFDLTENGTPKTPIATSELAGLPGCPHCGSPIGLVGCSACGGVHCIDGPGLAICPWCGVQSNYVQAEAGTRIEIGRGAG
ncbi:MAG: TerY-C metal binding domain-containing protein [Pseudomonadota bacterium]